jgi:TadE-like protein
MGAGPAAERGVAAVEFSLLAAPVVLVMLLVAQMALLLYQRNVVLTAVAEAARVAATAGRGPADGRVAACRLLAATIGDRCTSLRLSVAEEGPFVVARADGTLPSAVAGLGLTVRLTARVHDEDDLATAPPEAVPPAEREVAR